MVGHRVEHAQLDVGQRTHGERHGLGPQSSHQVGVLDAADAVVDALHGEDVQSLADVTRRPLLARMGDSTKSFGAGARENAGEFRRRMAKLGGVESHRDDPILERQRLLERSHRSLGAQVAEKTQDQPG